MDRLKNLKNADAKKQSFFRSAKYFSKKHMDLQSSGYRFHTVQIEELRSSSDNSFISQPLKSPELMNRNTGAEKCRLFI